MLILLLSRNENHKKLPFCFYYLLYMKSPPARKMWGITRKQQHEVISFLKQYSSSHFNLLLIMPWLHNLGGLATDQSSKTSLIWQLCSFFTQKSKKRRYLEHVYMSPEVNSNRFEISNRFEMSFRLHGNLHRNFTAASFQTIARLYCACANDIF